MRQFIKGRCGIGFAVIFALIILGFPISAEAKGPSSLPKTMIWSCYDVGSSGYVQASAIADALLKEFGTRVRLVPPGTGIGRLIPLATKRVQCGYLANEVYFATEGMFDFSTLEWGPQDLRVILAHPSSTSMLTTKVSGIKTPKDMKGKRVSWIVGNPSMYVKAEAQLAFAGLTWDDVIKVEFPSYASNLRALIEGKTDIATGTLTAPIIYELASTPKGFQVVEFLPDDKEAWKRAQKIAPFMFPAQETRGPGVSKDSPVWLAHVRYPMITVYSDADPDWVYTYIKAIDETFQMYKDSFPVMPDWKIEISGLPPADAPFHEGAIRYLREKGVWKAEHDAWNTARLEHMKKVQKAWEEAVSEAEAKKMKSKNFPEFWLKKRKEALGD